MEPGEFPKPHLPSSHGVGSPEGQEHWLFDQRENLKGHHSIVQLNVSPLHSTPSEGCPLSTRVDQRWHPVPFHAAWPFCQRFRESSCVELWLPPFGPGFALHKGHTKQALLSKSFVQWRCFSLTKVMIMAATNVAFTVCWTLYYAKHIICPISFTPHNGSTR